MITDYLHSELLKLQAITRGCSPDMHEPGQQHLTARVIGWTLDNANGEDIDVRAIVDGYQELAVILERGSDRLAVNLATLIALARMAQF